MPNDREIPADRMVDDGEYLIYLKDGTYSALIWGRNFTEILGHSPDLTADDFTIIELHS